MAFLGGVVVGFGSGLRSVCGWSGRCGLRGGKKVVGGRNVQRVSVLKAVSDSNEKGVRDPRTVDVLRVLRAVVDPDLGKDIVSLGFVQNMRYEDEGDLTAVSFDVELTTPACPIKDKFRTDCKALVEGLPWVSEAKVNMTAMDVEETVNGALRGVRSVIAVASCKGGVGKSTTAVNLAFSLAKAGARVGIMDADIYGPSLPTMVHPENDVVEFEDGFVKPMVYQGVKLMSFGYVNSDSAIMRGPMIANMLTQLLTTTNWGVLDYLIIDMPPGTGDIQLTLSQTLNITAAVIVTTPQRLSFVDVVKGLEMFNKVNIPSVAVVENMSYFEAPDTKVRHYLFGTGYTKKLQTDFGIRNSFGVPIEPQLAEKCDRGVPFVLFAPESETAKIYDQIAESLVREVARIQHGGLKLPKIDYDKEQREIIVSVEGCPEQRIKPAALRRSCRCAVCIDEMTGAKVLRDEDVSEDIQPRSIRAIGNYATQVDWSDGHSSLYPYTKFVKAWSTAESDGAPTEQLREEATVASS